MENTEILVANQVNLQYNNRYSSGLRVLQCFYFSLPKFNNIFRLDYVILRHLLFTEMETSSLIPAIVEIKRLSTKE